MAGVANAAERAGNGLDALFDAKQQAKLEAYDELATPMWVTVVADSRLVWANRAGLEVWSAASVEELAARDWENNTPTVRAAVRYGWEVALSGERRFGRWALYPKGRRVVAEHRVSPWRLRDGSPALLLEATPLEEARVEADVQRRAEVLHYARTPIAMFSESGVMVTSNAAFSREFVTDGLPAVVERDDMQTLLSAVKTNRRVEIERDLVREGGVRSYVIRADPAVDPATGEPAVVISLFETTMLVGQRRALASALDEARLIQLALEQRGEELERSNRDLESFAHVASHDLKAPLRTVSGLADLLREDCGQMLDEAGHEYLDLIQRGTSRMRRLLGDVLEFSSADRDIQREEVELSAVVDEALAMLDTSEADVSRDNLPTVYGDFAALTRVFANLIGNALKFRGDQALRIELDAVQNGDAWEISIRDNGIGFTAEQASMIFAPFRRLHGRSRYEGSGLGLSIVQRVVEAHGGRVWAQGEPDVGAAFFVALPC